MKNNTSPKRIKRSDYQEPEYWLDAVHLAFDLYEDRARVCSTLSLRRNANRGEHTLRLDGEALKLLSVTLDGRTLSSSEYAVDDEGLTLSGLGDTAELVIETECEPQNNTRLEGLYKSSGNFCTQCEAQGFRRITYFLDRPDVMARYSVEITADQTRYPVLLSNGNRVAHDTLEGNRHRVRWEDPFPKPAYLFALVAGDLACISDTFTTRSGREVDLHIYVEHHNKDKCAHAMTSLIKSMAWDESRFSLEYDLDIYMIVAVDDFNMGAMENKGLNVFNSKFVLADRESATDVDFEGVESVIAHEYFHNWTGNRVTCRDWFQLSLKEGLTVFRDQEFSADLNDRAVKRIDDVRTLRARQFPEDAGPMAHPIRPDSYIEINNFYTATVYEKGAEVIRMMHTLLGESRFQQGMQLYFERHDGQAVTCEDFVAAMETASGVDLQQFRRWYSQAGTPTVELETAYDAASESLTLTFSQTCKTQPQNLPLHIPVIVGLLDRTGTVISAQLQGAPSPVEQHVLNLTEATQQFVFTGVSAEPVISALRNFSAPVHLVYAADDTALALQMKHDTDAFNRWDAGQRLAIRCIEQGMQGGDADSETVACYVNAIGALLGAHTDDAALRAEALSLPSFEAIAELQETVDVDAILSARQGLRQRLAQAYGDRFAQVYQACAAKNSASVDAETMGVRRLKNICLHYLTARDTEHWASLVLDQYKHAQGMTDALAALGELSHTDLAERETCLQDFYTRWRDSKLVIDKWFALQAMSRRASTLDDVLALTTHDDFDTSNPNRVRSLVAAFAMNNPLCFHALDGRGYTFLADYIIRLDKTNPQLAARLSSPLSRWQRYTADRQALMIAQLRRISATEGLSPDVFEIVNKSLEHAGDDS